MNERTKKRFCWSQIGASATGRLSARAAANKQPSAPKNSLARTHMPNLARVELHGPWPKGLFPPALLPTCYNTPLKDVPTTAISELVEVSESRWVVNSRRGFLPLIRQVNCIISKFVSKLKIL